MSVSKVAVTVERELLEEVDRWVRAGEFRSRSQAVRAGLDRLREDRARRGALLSELAKLDPAEERRMAEEWLTGEVNWTQS